MNENTDYRTALKKLTSDRPIAYHRIYGQIAGSMTAGIMLSQLLYWWDKKYEDYIWKTIEEFEQETGLSRWEQSTAIKKLVARGFLHVEVKGLPAKRRFYLNEEAIFAALAGKPQIITPNEPKDMPQDEPQKPTDDKDMHRSSITDSVSVINSNGKAKRLKPKKRKSTPNQREFERLTTDPEIIQLKKTFCEKMKIPMEDGYSELTNLRSWEKLRNEMNDIQAVEALIDVASQDSFYAPIITNAQKLYANRMTLLTKIRAGTNNKGRIGVMEAKT